MNEQITKLTREILNLEERYPIKSKRTVDSRMKEAVLDDDPTKVMAALQPDEEAMQQLRKQRVDVLARECNKYYGKNGVKNPGVLPGYSKEQIDELVARGVREGPDALRPQERRVVAHNIGPGTDTSSKRSVPTTRLPVGAGVVAGGGGLEVAAEEQRKTDASFGTKEEQLREIQELRQRIAEVKLLQAREQAKKKAESAATSVD